MNDTEDRTTAIEPLRYQDVAEIVEVSVRGANDYLAHGYTLLGIYNRTLGANSPKGDFYVRKGPIYVVARSAQVEPYTPQDTRADR